MCAHDAWSRIVHYKNYQDYIASTLKAWQRSAGVAAFWLRILEHDMDRYGAGKEKKKQKRKKSKKKCAPFQ